MIDFSGYNFTKAEAAYVVANTPLFIVRNLKSDPAVIKVAGSFSVKQIVDEIRERLGTPPGTARDRIIPFILLGALAVRQERAAIAEVATIESASYRWFKPVVESLLATVRPVARSTIQVTQPEQPTALKSRFSNKVQTLEPIA